MGPRAFSERTGVDFNTSRDFIDQYFLNFKGIANFVEKVIAETKENGFSETLFGRKRFLPEINSRDPRLRAQSERMARNFPVQGMSADIMKIAMAVINEKKILDKDCQLLLQIHDELLFEVAETGATKKAEEIRKAMENVVKLKISMAVKTSIGKNWRDL